MALYTIDAFKKIINDIKNFLYIFGLIASFINVIYLTYSTFSKSGYLVFNIILLALSIFYLISYIKTHYKPDKKNKKLVATTKHIKKEINLILNFIEIVILIYSVCNTASNTSTISILLVAFMAMLWVVQVILEILVYVINKEFELIEGAFLADAEPINKIIHARTTTENFFKTLKGETVEKTEDELKAEKSKAILDKYREKIHIVK